MQRIFFAWLVIFFFQPKVFAVVELKINGSTTVNPVIVDAAQKFQKQGWRILLDTQGGSSGGLASLAEGLSDIGMVSRALNEHDKRKFPSVKFEEHILGFDGVALVVSKKLYDAGIRALSKEQIRLIYEGKIKNWQSLGGPDSPIVFFNKEPGRGTWEVFAQFLYGNVDRAPKVFHSEVGANQEARSKVARHPSAITQLSASWAWNQEGVRPLAIKTENGELIKADRSHIESGRYPMRRPLTLVTRGPAQGHTKEFIDYLRSSEGQALVNKHGYLGLKEK